MSVAELREKQTDAAMVSEVLKEAITLSEMMIFGFLIKETPKIFKLNTKQFMFDRCGSEARSVCFYLAQKHANITLEVMANKFKMQSKSNLSERISSIKEAIRIERSYQELIEKIKTIESNLKTFLDKNNISHGKEI